MSARYEIRKSEKLGRYLVAAKHLKAGEVILSDQPFVVGPASDTCLVCFNCYLPLINKFLVCKSCAVAPVCAGDGCPYQLPEWHNEAECEFFRKLKLSNGLSPMVMVQNVGSLLALRAILKKTTDPEAWEEFMQLETHLEQRRNSSVWQYYESTVKFISSLGLLDGIDDGGTLVQKVCAAIDVNSFEVRGPAAATGSELLRGVYARAALLAHECVANTHLALTDRHVLVCRASVDLAPGDVIYYNYTDPLKGTLLRQRHLLIGKYFTCTCERCSDPTELGTHLSSALCPSCTAYITRGDDAWTCAACDRRYDIDAIDYKVKCCSDKLEVINKKDEKELEEYIKHVSLVLAPQHYLLVEAKQRLAGALRASLQGALRPRRALRRQRELCRELLTVQEALCPGVCRTKAITLFELHITIVQLAKKLYDAREITATDYMDELLEAEKHLKRALEMLLIEPGNSPEGELCAKALELYRSLKNTMCSVLDTIHAEGKSYDSVAERELQESEHLNDVE